MRRSIKLRSSFSLTKKLADIARLPQKFPIAVVGSWTTYLFAKNKFTLNFMKMDNFPILTRNKYGFPVIWSKRHLYLNLN